MIRYPGPLVILSVTELLLQAVRSIVNYFDLDTCSQASHRIQTQADTAFSFTKSHDQVDVVCSRVSIFLRFLCSVKFLTQRLTNHCILYKLP